ncbi:MAG: sulfatase-like hydrolase/transferase [Planctomycetes bacterium]|nr:sulfatase-like hydrolase/transferase [Planctomycetota bacterium]
MSTASPVSVRPFLLRRLASAVGPALFRLGAFALTTALANLAFAQNVLIVIADDVGVDAIGCYGAGASPPPTPNIDALAGRGVRFTRAHGCPTCSPTRASIQTGRYPFRTGVGHPLGNPETGLAASEVLLPEVLAATQRPRALFGKWHLGDATGNTTPNDQGWPHFAGTMYGGVSDYFHFTLITNGVSANVNQYSPSALVDRALAWIGARQQPWLAMVCFHSAHTPRQDPPALLHGYALNGLDPTVDRVLFHKAMVQAMDTEIGRLLTGLGARTLAATNVIFLGDNGTERDVVEAPFTAAHAKATLYEGGTHVPMIVAGPAVANTPRTSAALVDTVDLFPTIATMCGVDVGLVVPPNVPLDGHDLRPLLQDTATSVRGWGYSEQDGVSATADGHAIQEARFKLIRFTGGASVSEELYDLQLDPLETTNLLAGALSTTAERAYIRLRVAAANLRREAYSGSFGSGCAGSAGVPAISSVGGPPRLAQNHLVRVTPIGGASSSVGLLGFSMDHSAAGPLPLDLTALGLTGCSLLVSADGNFPAVLSATAATWPMPIPNNAALLGLPFYQQVALVEAGANPANIILSNALASVIGP